MEKTNVRSIPRRGRPLSFDRKAALQQAMHAFWQTGYETTSIADLTAAMKVTAPSIYAAFGDKKGLFLEAVRLYAGDPDEMKKQMSEAPTSREAAHGMLTGAALAFTGKGTPRGCLLASATASGSEASADVMREVARIRKGIENMLRLRIRRDIEEGVLPERTDGESLAMMVIALISGMSVLARDGAPRKKLIAMADQAIRAWPERK